MEQSADYRAEGGGRLVSMSHPFHILAMGGSTRPDSACERALRLAAQSAAAAGADVTYLTGRALLLPIYDTETSDRAPEAQRLVEAMRAADGLLVASPGYHGAVSGMVKNALDYAEDLRFDARPYLDGRSFGCIGVAHGWQAAVAAMNELRQIAHALRAWPTPLGCAINDATATLGVSPDSTEPAAAQQLAKVGAQVVHFARSQRALRESLRG